MSQTILIAGASRGIGLEIAHQAAARGDRVLAMVRSGPGQVAAAEVAAQVLTADVTDEAALAAAAVEVDTKIDLLVCNAGIFRGRGGLDAEDAGSAAWSDVLMTNVAGPFLTVRAFLPKLAEGAKIAIISSVMGSSARAPGGSYLYRASKAAATNLACNLAGELKPRGIAVGAYHPGWVRTDMGGASAAVSPADSAAGLLVRFDALDLATTGVFEDYRGDIIPF